jgi:hypothetical protein
MADIRADRRAVGLVETTVWVPKGRAPEISYWAWRMCLEYLEDSGQMERYEALREASKLRDKEGRQGGKAGKSGL